jgi:hypothetical protein
MINSQDEHIKRELVKRGWKENRLQSSTFFDFKWNYTDNPDDYKNLREG